MEKKKVSPIVEPRKIHKVGRAIMISLPKEWFKAHNIDPDKVEELIVVANRDIRIVNPQDADEVYKEISEMVRRAKL